jgi:hypothetical protein
VPDPSKLLVTEFLVVKQRCTGVGVCFDDQAVADYFERMVDRGLNPQQFGRVWLHTHPGGCPEPSGLDEDTFDRVFGRCDWAVMFVLARGGASYARLRFSAGPRGEIALPVRVRWDLPLGNVDQDQWQAEYKANVVAEPMFVGAGMSQCDCQLDVVSERALEQLADETGAGLEGLDFGYEGTEVNRGFVH